jgi:hypothetical protein
LWRWRSADGTCRLHRPTNRRLHLRQSYSASVLYVTNESGPPLVTRGLVPSGAPEMSPV